MEEKTTNLSTGQQQFNLRWNNHTNNILQVFTEQLNNEALVDVTISCEGQYLKAHKMILSACSPYFQELFRVHTVSHPLIIINGMKYNDVKQVIDFMYRGEVKVLEADLESILAVAESLQVKGLSTVRNSYEKHDVSQTNDQSINEMPTPDQTNTVSSVQQAKKRKMSSNIDESTESVSDESLSSTIKIEPPEIVDIDQDDEKVIETTETESRKIATPKPLKTSKSGRTLRPKSYDYTEPISIPKKTSSPNYTCHGFVDPANKALKIPRPPNAFMIFANEWRKKLATENPKDSNKEISIRLGVMWKSLGPDAKESYYSASRKADEEHKRKYPGYYYSPKEARIRKNLKETLTTNKSKKNCDAMRFIKVVMKDNTDAEVAERWRPSDEKEDDPDIISVNVNIDSDEDTRSESALQIDTSPEADSSSPKE